ncbi:glycosyltransferase family 4 protein [Nonomuraea sp. FMUSA5-5]|uniref:Glycosyltransferase family 4 protein n=1 Tax=Nonomuraea composti TaxID=2720023 RepID=A0ABX1B8Y2_9ACTN|nr:glycosyltransferase family 4 protein [Nonomuraea sp. FMUSA5-5]NJP91623.1 glycosyltransferase family 4 protein [Nonomuraea sp. FMUSA5-5]
MTAIVTVLDVPTGSPGGSIELLHDLYAGSGPLIPARVFMLEGDQPPLPPIEILHDSGKCLTGSRFWAYADTLTTQLTAILDPSDVALTHLQHLAFGASPALLRALPGIPSLALVHGTDLLHAACHDTQHRVLQHVAGKATAIVVPTPAMADRLRQLAPALDATKIHQVPWGVPDDLLSAPPSRSRTGGEGPFRLLYAGRLTAEKGVRTLAEACANTVGTTLSIAAPPTQYTNLAARLQALRCSHRYLGWLTRRQLWECFRQHDALVIPSTTLEAFGLVAIEAQACGLPVLYQPVPGLVDVLADSALPLDFTDPAALTATLHLLRHDPALPADLQAAGYANARRYPISNTATALTELGNRII